jgi:hypothetical protein
MTRNKHHALLNTVNLVLVNSKYWSIIHENTTTYEVVSESSWTAIAVIPGGGDIFWDGTKVGDKVGYPPRENVHANVESGAWEHNIFHTITKGNNVVLWRNKLLNAHTSVYAVQ